MKALTSPEMPRQRSMRRVSKPLMEKRRRERINHSLETLRLLMLDNTHNEKLRNPKVEKAEILETVVNFLKTEKEVEKEVGGHLPVKRVPSMEHRATSARQRDFQDGMRSCLLRVSRFIASQSRGSEDTEGAVQASLALQEPQTHPSSPGHLHRAQAALSRPFPHHSYLTQRTGMHCDTRELLSSTAESTHITDPVWRPWPQ